MKELLLLSPLQNLELLSVRLKEGLHLGRTEYQCYTSLLVHNLSAQLHCAPVEFATLKYISFVELEWKQPGGLVELSISPHHPSIPNIRPDCVLVTMSPRESIQHIQNASCRSLRRSHAPMLPSSNSGRQRQGILHPAFRQIGRGKAKRNSTRC